MSEPPDRPAPPTGGVAGDVAGRLGEDVGRFARLAMRRLEQMASAGAAMAGQMMAGTPTAAHAGPAQRDAGAPGSTAPDAPAPDAPTPGSATARAEAMVDGAGAQLGTLATVVSRQLRRAAALAREEAEDMWAEAQQIRAAQRREPDEGQGNLA